MTDAVYIKAPNVGNGRKTFEMSQAQFDKMLEACKPVPYLIAGGIAPRSAQENANDAWHALGAEMGFDWETVEPAGANPRSFTAVAKVTP